MLGTMPPGIPQPGWQIYPNPAANFIYVDLREIREPGRILLYSISGELVRSEPSEPGARMLIDVSDLDPGIYLLRMQGTNHTEKLVVY
jgi:hypothetical protein